MKNISSYMKISAVFISLLIFAPMMAGATNYYLHDSINEECNGRLMDASSPSSPYTASLKLEDENGIWCTKPFNNEVEISGDVRVTLYIEAFFLIPDVIPVQFRFIKVSLLDIYGGNMDVIGASRVIPLIFISNNTLLTKTFIINNVDYSIPAGHSLGIKVEKAIDFLSYFPFSLVAPFFYTNVLYDSIDAPSFAEIPVNITAGGIYIECYDRNENVKPGNEVEYGLIIGNNASIKQEVQLSHNYRGDEWEISMPTHLTINANSFNYTTVKVKAPADAAPGDYLNITITAMSGSSSYSIWLNTTVVAFEHGVEITAKDSKVKGKPGEKVNITFQLKNTGDTEDTYSLNVKCKWKSEIEEKQVMLASGESKNILVGVNIPLNASNGTSTDVTLIANSIYYDVGDNATSHIIVEYTVTPPPPSNIMTLVGYALFVVGVVILLVIAAYLGKISKKTVSIQADERIKEITPGKKVIFTIKLSNPLEKLKKGKNRIKYRIGIEGKIPEKWVAKLDNEEIIMDGGESTEVKLHVDVPEDAPIDEWASIDVVVTPNKGKSEHLNFLITLKEPEPVLSMEYEHKGEMEEGKKVVTKIRIKNEGDADALNKSVVIMVNGKEKNRIDGINIAAGGEVEIELPWIAEEENEVEVKII